MKAEIVDKFMVNVYYQAIYQFTVFTSNIKYHIIKINLQHFANNNWSARFVHV